MTIKEFLFNKNKYNSLPYRIRYFFKYRIPFVSPGWYKWHFPYYHWWKARKIFKRPKAHFTFSKKKIWFYGMPICESYYNRVIDIRMSALGWKTKWSSYRHEWDPYISIILFNKYHFLWIFNWADSTNRDTRTSSMATWEAILDYLYHKVPVEKLIDKHTWLSGIEEDSHYITIERNMYV